MYSFKGEKRLLEARRRDFIRSRLPAGRRWRADDEAEVLYQEAVDEQDFKQRQLDWENKGKAYDGAMESATRGVKRDGSIKKFII